jgi:hypothetical protein
MIDYLPADIPGHHQGEHSGDGIPYEVRVADFLCDDLQTWAGAQCLYMDLVMGQVEWFPAGKGCGPSCKHRKILRQPPH